MKHIAHHKIVRSATALKQVGEAIKAGKPVHEATIAVYGSRAMLAHAIMSTAKDVSKWCTRNAFPKHRVEEIGIALGVDPKLLPVLGETYDTILWDVSVAIRSGTPFKEAMELRGARAALAHALGITPPMTQRWVLRGAVPPRRRESVSKVLKCLPRLIPVHEYTRPEKVKINASPDAYKRVMAGDGDDGCSNSTSTSEDAS